MPEIRYGNYYTDMRALILAMVEPCLVEYRGQKSYKIYEGIPSLEQVNQNRNYVYLYRMDGSQGEDLTTCKESRSFTFRIGVCRKNDEHNVGQRDRYWQQVDNLNNLFGMHWRNETQPFTFQGGLVSDLTTLGVQNIEQTPPIPRPNGNVESIEFGVTFTIQYNNNNLKAA